MDTEPTWKRQGFKSDCDYQKHLAKEKGFDSLAEYREHLAREKGFGSYYEYQEYLTKGRGFESYYEYQEHLAKEKGFKSRYKQRLCKSLQEITSNVKDPESLFNDIEFIRKISGCKIPIKEKKQKTKLNNRDDQKLIR